MSFECKIYEPQLWAGYYRRIPGEETTFHVPSDEEGPVRPYVYWTVGLDRARCFAVECDGAYALAEAVNTAKRFLGSYGGGSFLVNERRQVLVPASDGSGRIAFAGEITGRLVFENPFEPGTLLDLADDSELEIGDVWNKPYVGMWYNLSEHNRLYYVQQTRYGDNVVYFTEPELVRRLRRIRRRGAVRFIINPHGIVLTKVPSTSEEREIEEWIPVYVGRSGRVQSLGGGSV